MPGFFDVFFRVVAFLATPGSFEVEERYCLLEADSILRRRDLVSARAPAVDELLCF
jgi:hypothetical protein